MEHPTKQQMVDRIAAAWAGVPYPGDENLLSSSALAYKARGEAYCKFDLLLEEFLRGKTWQQAREGLLDRMHTEGIGMLSPQAYFYYMPAFLTALVDPRPNDYEGMADRFRSSLMPANHVTLATFLLNIECLSDNHRKVVRDVLIWLDEEREIDAGAEGRDGVGWCKDDTPGTVRPPDYWEDPEQWFDYHGDNVKDDPDFREDPEGWVNKYCQGIRPLA